MIYFIIGFYLLFLACKYDIFGSKDKSAKKFHYYFSLIILILLAALRYRIGGDTCRYMDLYGGDLSSEADLGGRFQPLWRLLTNILYSVSPDFTLFQFVHAIFLNTVHFFFFQEIFTVGVCLHFPLFHKALSVFEYRNYPAIVFHCDISIIRPSMY